MADIAYDEFNGAHEPWSTRIPEALYASTNVSYSQTAPNGDHYESDPILWARNVLGVDFLPWQEAALRRMLAGERDVIKLEWGNARHRAAERFADRNGVSGLEVMIDESWMPVGGVCSVEFHGSDDSLQHKHGSRMTAFGVAVCPFCGVQR